VTHLVRGGIGEIFVGDAMQVVCLHEQMLVEHTNEPSIDHRRNRACVPVARLPRLANLIFYCQSESLYFPYTVMRSI
jgi:hypothetical protein